MGLDSPTCVIFFPARVRTSTTDAMANPKSKIENPKSDEGSPSVQKPVVTVEAESQPDSPRIIYRDGEAYLDEYDIPIWRLEMGRRAGSSPAALMATSPGLTQKGLDLAFAYAQEHKAEFDPLIRLHSGEDVPEEDEGDEEDEATFEAELDALF